MKYYRLLFISLVIILSALAFIPAIAFPWKEKITWQNYAQVYQPQTFSIYLPVVQKH